MIFKYTPGSLCLVITHSTNVPLTFRLNGVFTNTSIIKKVGGKDELPWDSLNLFLESVPARKLDTLYQIYAEVIRTLSRVHNAPSRSIGLGTTQNSDKAFIIKETRKLIGYVDHLILDEPKMEKWVLANIPIPSDIPAKYIDTASTTRKQTITRSDYVSLAAFALVMKLITPMTTSGLSRLRPIVGTTKVAAVGMYTGLSKWKAYIKLEKYISQTRDTDLPLPIILRGELSSQNYHINALGVMLISVVTLIRCLKCDNKHHMAKKLYETLCNLANPSIAANYVQDAKPVDSGSDDDNELSVWSNPRLGSRIPIATQALHVQTCGEAYLLSRLPIDPVRYRKVRRTIGVKSVNFRVDETHIILASWYMYRWIHPDAYYFISRDNLLNVCAALFCLDHIDPFLSLYMLTMAVETENYKQPKRSRLPPKLKELIVSENHYPFLVPKPLIHQITEQITSKMIKTARICIIKEDFTSPEQAKYINKYALLNIPCSLREIITLSFINL